MEKPKREWKNGIPCKHNGNDGDSLLWSGLLYSVSGFPEYGMPIRESQDFSGRLWRSPSRVGVNKSNSFSRDMALGFLLAAARDKANGSSFGLNGESLERWVSYIKRTGKLCPDATDNRSTPTVALWWYIAYVRPDLVAWQYRFSRFLLKPYLWIAAETAKPGYPKHLIACAILMLYVLSGKREKRGFLKAAADKLEEEDHNNPFFMWLNLQEKDAQDELDWLNIQFEEDIWVSNGSQWFLEREDEEDARVNSCGHDLDFLALLLGSGIK